MTWKGRSGAATVSCSPLVCTKMLLSLGEVSWRLQIIEIGNEATVDHSGHEDELARGFMLVGELRKEPNP